MGAPKAAVAKFTRDFKGHAVHVAELDRILVICMEWSSDAEARLTWSEFKGTFVKKAQCLKRAWAVQHVMPRRLKIIADEKVTRMRSSISNMQSDLLQRMTTLWWTAINGMWLAYQKSDGSGHDLAKMIGSSNDTTDINLVRALFDGSGCTSIKATFDVRREFATEIKAQLEVLATPPAGAADGSLESDRLGKILSLAQKTRKIQQHVALMKPLDMDIPDQTYQSARSDYFQVTCEAPSVAVDLLNYRLQKAKAELVFQLPFVLDPYNNALVGLASVAPEKWLEHVMKIEEDRAPTSITSVSQLPTLKTFIDVIDPQMMYTPGKPGHNLLARDAIVVLYAFDARKECSTMAAFLEEANAQAVFTNITRVAECIARVRSFSSIAPAAIPLSTACIAKLKDLTHQMVKASVSIVETHSADFVTAGSEATIVELFTGFEEADNTETFQKENKLATLHLRAPGKALMASWVALDSSMAAHKARMDLMKQNRALSAHVDTESMYVALNIKMNININIDININININIGRRSTLPW